MPVRYSSVKKNILVVDDEAIILETLSRDLEAEGYGVMAASNGGDAITRLKEDGVDLVITDLVMEGLDGIQVLKQTKSINPALPVIILTGFGDLKSAIDALRLGADDYMLKPCEIEELVIRISRCFEKKRLLEQLQIQNQQLVEEIAARIRAEEALQENTEKIKRFAYSVSHDLKSPVIAMHGLAKRLHLRYAAELGEKGRLCSDQLAKTAEQVLALVDSINAYMSAKDALLTVEKISLQEVVWIIKEEFASRLEARQVKFIAPARLPEINADKLSLLRALRNFVDNALKYGGERLTEIAVGYRETPQHHMLYVKDNGVGLQEKEPKTIFGFFQRSRVSRDIEGTGLGLAIVGEIARRHGGELDVKSCSNKGTVFYLSISKDLALSP